ncbi:MAG: hypothetical protein NNA18_04200 [Nitrospira sp.]|nr:hypothetical protein [Nitrospira sp.]
MKSNKAGQQWWRAGGAVWVMVCTWGLAACSGTPPKPSSPLIAPDEVRSHADRAFDRLKQEERERAGQETPHPLVPSR